MALLRRNNMISIDNIDHLNKIWKWNCDQNSGNVNIWQCVIWRAYKEAHHLVGLCETQRDTSTTMVRNLTTCSKPSSKSVQRLSRNCDCDMNISQYWYISVIFGRFRYVSAVSGVSSRLLGGWRGYSCQSPSRSDKNAQFRDYQTRNCEINIDTLTRFAADWKYVTTSFPVKSQRPLATNLL